MAKDLEREREIPPPKKYPVTFDGFLRLTLGGRHKPRRVKIYREYVRNMIWQGHVGQIKYPQSAHQRIARAVMTTEDAEKLAAPPSLDEIELGMNEAKRRTYDTNEFYQLYARDFLRWWHEYRRQQAKKSADRRWRKQKPTP